MKIFLVRSLSVSALSFVLVSGSVAQETPKLMNEVARVLEGSRLVVDTPSSTNFTHLVKTYSQVSSEGCALKYVETADESGKMVDGKPQTRHSTYAFTVNLAQATGPISAVLTRGQRSDHLYYSVPMAFQSEQPIAQKISIDGVETTSALLKHTTASFEVDGQERGSALQGALNAAIKACAAK